MTSHCPLVKFRMGYVSSRMVAFADEATALMWFSLTISRPEIVSYVQSRLRLEMMRSQALWLVEHRVELICVCSDGENKNSNEDNERKAKKFKKTEGTTNTLKQARSVPFTFRSC